MVDTRTKATELANKILEIFGEAAVHVTEQQKRDAEQYLYGLLLEAEGRGIRAGVMDRVRKREHGEV